MHHISIQYQISCYLKKEISSQSCKPLGYYGMACARDRASLIFLKQGTVCEILRDKAEPGPCPSGCQRQVQAMADLSQTLFVSNGHLARPLSKEGVSQDLEPWGEIKMSWYCASWQRWLMERPCSSEGKPFLQPPFQGCNYPPAASVPPLALMSLRRNNCFLRSKSLQAQTHHPSTQINTWGTWATPNCSGFSWLFGARHWYCSALRPISRWGQRNKGCIWRVSKCAVWRPEANFSSSWGRPEQAKEKWAGWAASCCLPRAVPTICQFCDAISWEKPEMQLWITAVIIKHI